jgi:FkbM family methyltransferase
VIQRTVELATRAGGVTEVRVCGRDDDRYVDKLPRRLHEAALECARVLLTDDAVVIDAGANVGVLAVGFALLAPRGQVVAIEASPTTFADLRRNVGEAGVDNVELVECAVGERAGTLEFFDSSWFSAGSFVKEPTMASALHEGSISVEARSIDDIVAKLALERVDLVKLDVEGHELPALRGARETLARFQPVAVIELNLFAVTSFGNTLPFDYLADVRSTFPYVYDYALGEGLVPITTDDDAYQRVQSQFLLGRPTDLVCAFTPLSDAAVAELTRTAMEVPASLHARVAELEHEVRELRSSTSWRVTAPLRKLSSKLRREDTR